MKPQLGDIVISRYTLVSLLRSMPGLEAWKANDRVLARDCQLFIVTDKAIIPSFEAIASTLTLSRNPHFTPIIQIQHVNEIPVLITNLDGGVTLNNYLGHGAQKLGYEAMRSIIGEAADGLDTLLHDDLYLRSLNTNAVRVTSHGVQIADAPLAAMLNNMLPVPHMAPEMLTIHALAALLYAMLTGKRTSEIKDFDFSELPKDTPKEFRTICERGLKIQDMDEQSTLPMVSLGELVGLLGEWKPLATLPNSEIALPTSDGEASISRLPLRRARRRGLIDFPENLFSSQLQFRANQAAGNSTSESKSSKASLSKDDAPVPSTTVSAANTPSAGKKSDSKATVTDAASKPSKPAASNQKADTTPASESASKPQSDKQDVQQGKSSKLWHQRNRNRRGRNEFVSLTNPNDSAPRMDLHDLTAAEMADAFKSFDSTADDSIFPEFNQHTAHTNNPTMQFDFAVEGDSVDMPDENPGSRTEATGRIPVLDANGNYIAPGYESARALQEEQEAIAEASPVILPPSFTPQQKAPQTDATGDDIANTPLLGKLTTKVVAIVTVVVLIIAAAGIAAYKLIGHGGKNGGSYQQSSADPWPEMNLNKVPFGAETADGNDSNKQENDTPAKNDSTKTNKDDKIANAVPAPSIPVNNTPLTIDKQEFYHSPAGQRGLAYYMHLSTPANVTRFVVRIRTSGGTGYLLANTSQDPNAGQQVAQFTFDQSGTTDVKLDKPTQSQDFMLWVPMDSLPNRSLYIEQVQLY
jgi:putative peptidoglycan lipid II flippase